MATTTTAMGQPTRTTNRNEVSNRNIYWAVAIAIVVLLALGYSMRTARDVVAPAAPTATTTTTQTTTLPDNAATIHGAVTDTQTSMESSSANVNGVTTSDVNTSNVQQAPANTEGVPIPTTNTAPAQ